MKYQNQSITLLIIILFAIGINSGKAQRVKADLIIRDATIYMTESIGAGVNSIAVNEGKIVFMGTEAEVEQRYDAKQTIHAKGAYVYPGFTDAHSHFMGLALGLRYADLNKARSFDEILDVVKAYRKAHPGGWVIGWGWDQNNWPEKVFPDNKQLNKLFSGVPIVLIRIDGHAVLASDAAWKAAGIVYPCKKGEAIVENGQFTGVFLEEMADKLRNAIPLPSKREMDSLLMKATAMCHSAGLTAVTDAGLNKSEILMLDSLQKAGKISLRIDAWLSPTEENFGCFLKDSMYETPFLRVGAIKMYADGALGSRGACLLKPFQDAATQQGIIVTTPEALEAVCKRAYDHHFQMCTHAIGDSAVRMVLHTYAKFLKPGDDRRWRIEHSQVVNEDDFKLFGQYHIVPSVQATHATSDMKWADERLGPERVKNAYAYNRLLQQNGWIPNGTDFPIEGIEPIHTFYAAVARKNAEGLPEGGYMMENALSRQDAMKSITVWAAKASFTDTMRGSIEVGKFADFTILDTDLLKAKEGEILGAKVVYTIVGGKVVYEMR